MGCVIIRLKSVEAARLLHDRFSLHSSVMLAAQLAGSDDHAVALMPADHEFNDDNSSELTDFVN
jgi:hypothetical protein